MRPYARFTAITTDHATHASTARGIHHWTDNERPGVSYLFHGKKTKTMLGTIQLLQDNAIVATIDPEGTLDLSGYPDDPIRAAIMRAFPDQPEVTAIIAKDRTPEPATCPKCDRGYTDHDYCECPAGDAALAIDRSAAEQETPEPTPPAPKKRTRTPKPVPVVTTPESTTPEPTVSAPQDDPGATEPAEMTTDTPPRIAVLARTLSAALAALKPAILKKTALPILQAVHIETTGQTLTISATDLEVFAVQRVHYSRVTAGHIDTVIEFAALADAIKSARPDDLIEIEQTSATRLTITAAGMSRTLTTLDPEQYPVAPTTTAQDAQELTMPAQDLNRILQRVKHARATDNTRPVLWGTCLEAKRGTLTAAAANGFVLSLDETDIDSAEAFKITIGQSMTAALHAAKVTGDVRLTLTGAGLLTQWETGSIFARLIDGTFPDYRQIVPREYAATVDLPRADLLAAVKSLATVAKSNNDVMRINLGSMNGTLELTAKGDNDQAQASCQVRTESHTGEARDMALNAIYVRDLLTATTNPSIRLSVNTPNMAACFTNPNGRDLTVVMPMVTPN